MRKIMWFTLGFCIAAAAGACVLPMGWYLLSAGICALALGVMLCLTLRFTRLRLVVFLLVGAILGFGFQAGFDGLYLTTVRQADEMTLDVSIYATDYSYETDYGCAVMGRVELNGKQYKVLTYLPENTTLSPGDWVNGSFRLGSTLPDGSRDSQINRGDAVFLKAYETGEVTVYAAQHVPLWAQPARIHRYISDLLRDLFPEDVFAFAQALLLGDTDDLSYAVDTDLKVSGIRHVAAVSGLHVTILFSLVYVLTGRRKWLAALLGFPVLVLFALVAGFSPSIVRACVMLGLMILAILLNRAYDGPSALSFAVLILLLINPWSITDVSFQLSVCSLTGILLLGEPMRKYMMDPKRLGRFRGMVGKCMGIFSSAVSVSIGAAIFTAPISAYYFGMVSLLSVLTNLLALWVVSFVFYGILLVCLVAMIHAPLAAGIAWFVAWPIRCVLAVAHLVAQVPFAAVYTTSIYIVIWLVFSYILLAVFLLMKHKEPALLAVLSLLTLCIALYASWMEPLEDDCRVTVLDVGQGQCILLQSEGKNFLVDCGGSHDISAANEAAALLLSQGISRLDGLIITHYDVDHAGGAVYLLQRVDADCLYLPNCADVDGTADALYAYPGQIYTVSDDAIITFGDTKITLIPSQSQLSSNESGLCVLYQTQNCDILITGDRTAAGERELIAHMQLPQLEVLIVGHHGSKYSTSLELLQQTMPQYAIISVGDNRYGHPTQEVLDRLEDFGCIVYRTDENGTVIFRR